MKIRVDRTQLIAYSLLLLNAVLWGVSPGIIKIGLREIEPMVFIYYRHLVVALVLLPYLVYTKQIKRSLEILKNPKYLLVMGLLTPWTLILLFYGLEKTTSMVASLLSALSPIVAGILGVLLLKETITKNERLGTLLSFTGVVLLIFLQSGEASVGFTNNIVGMFLIILATVLWVLGSILFKKIPQKDKDLVSLNSFFFSIINFIVIFLITDPGLLIPSSMQVATGLSVLYMAIFASLIAFIAFQKALEKVEVSEANIFTYLQPLFGIPISIMLLGEKFTLAMLIPLGIVVAGVWLYVKEKFILSGGRSKKSKS